MGDIRVAIVGCGAVARRHHLPAFTRNSRANVVVLCDPDPGAVAIIRQRFGLNCRECRDFEDVLSDTTVDAVSICAPSFTHYDYARRAISAGKHVLLEKPPVYRTEQALELISLAKQRDVKLGVVFNYRYRDLTEKVVAAREQGLLGKIVKLQIIHHANLVYSESPWVWDERKSKYLLYEYGIHFLDLMVHLCGEHEEIVSAVPTRQHSVQTTTDLQAVIRFKSGALGLLDLTQDSTRHSSYFTHVYVYGTGMDAFVRFFPPLVSFAAGMDSPQNYLIREFKTLSRFARLMLTGKFLSYRNHAHQRVIDMYIAWLTDGTPYPLTMQEALPTIRLLNDLEQRIPAYGPMSGAATKTAEMAGSAQLRS
jgi:UDP-N-acetyl-2-amino-2-deoxyglucuronate dehydrogenase